jgi:hypothetical protein
MNADKPKTLIPSDLIETKSFPIRGRSRTFEDSGHTLLIKERLHYQIHLKKRSSAALSCRAAFEQRVSERR